MKMTKVKEVYDIKYFNDILFQWGLKLWNRHPLSISKSYYPCLGSYTLLNIFGSIKKDASIHRTTTFLRAPSFNEIS